MATPVAFSFKDNIRDVSGFGHETATFGSPTFSLGKYDRGLACFSGDAITIFYDNWSYYNDLTGGKSFGCWVKAEPGAPGQTRVLYDRGEVKIYLADATGNASVILDSTVFSSNTDVCDGTWHHVLWSWDGAGNEGDPDNTHRWWIDGVQVNQTQFAPSYLESPGSYGWLGAAANGLEPLNGIISDVRIWNDPVYPNEVIYLRDKPVEDYNKGLFAFDDTSAGRYRDSSENRNHLVAGLSNLVTGHSGKALSPPAGWSTPYDPGPMDRITSMFWLKVDDLASVGEIFSFYAGATEKFSMRHIGGGRLECYCTRDTGSLGEETLTTNGAVLQQGTWHRIVLQAWASDLQLVVDGNVPSVTGDGGGNTTRPINLPSFTGITELRVGAGVQMDDLRVVSNWITAPALSRLFQQNLIDTIGSGLTRPGGKIIRIWRKNRDGSFTEMVARKFDSLSDTTAPLVPTGLRIIGTPGTTSFTIGWDATVDAGDVPDTDAPSVPTGLTATDLQANSFRLNWNASFDAGDEPDTTPPSVPTNLESSEIQDTSFKLDWSESTDA